MADKAPSTIEAFDLLAAEMEEAIEPIRAKAHAALDAGRFDEAQQLAERARGLLALAGRLAELKAEWARTQAPTRRPASTAGTRRSHGRLPGGVKTPDRDFRLPILQVLAKMGGRGEVAAVLDRVGVVMAKMLRPIDRQALRSDPDQPRWRNTAQWERLLMVEKGWLVKGSPRGVWEITDAGLRYLVTGGEGA